MLYAKSTILNKYFTYSYLYVVATTTWDRNSSSNLKVAQVYYELGF